MSSAGSGRPRDPEVDRRITRAVLDVFGEAGWAGFAMETVARRAGIGKATLYLRWSSKEELLTDALTTGLVRVGDVDTGTLHGDLVELATQVLGLYTGPAGRAAMRLNLETAIPEVAEHYRTMRASQIQAARDIVRRGVARGELPGTVSVSLLLETLIGGAMMHAMTTPADRRAALAEEAGSHARQLVDFLLHAVASPVADRRARTGPLFRAPA
ncbi:transcriptional regulator [Actinoplanes sp. SE50]|uniref:TetR/AcrR family transcriptional regulator n=1 Tax=unclassified Actinoplanes TaxID=2626549 RepID=UPI00023EC628|nr:MULTISPECIES: TetR/AcrR family transcriptional regulator [unclassified Actinoplanes]AEV84684.1 putative HTH-type transcriptional regulator [Actinoplanes sp. SE50/110]ATO83076.1 transcriptional regulator [Actinoplanes sp. SE50]SLM00483.1 TetR family transcriptional regulator [Actinoplanes sp. SE50/110]